MVDIKNSIKLGELIHWVKKELLSDDYSNDEPMPLFVIDEVSVEVNFTISGSGDGGVDLKVVKLGAKIGGQQVQKAVVKMKPLMSHQDLLSEYTKNHDFKKKLMNDSLKALIKGRHIDEKAIPERK